MASLEAKYAALETVYQLAYALDALNYHELSPHFHPDKKFNFDISAILGKPAQDVTLSEYFDIAVGGLGGFDATQHVLTNPLVTMNADGTAHIKVMVNALHAFFEEGKVEGAMARVNWEFVLENSGDRWFVVKWIIVGRMPIDGMDIFEKGHARAHDGKLRSSIVRP